MKPQSNLTVNYPSMPELTARGMILGALITVIFTASIVGPLVGGPSKVSPDCTGWDRRERKVYS